MSHRGNPFSAPWSSFPPPPPKKRSQLYSHGHPNDRRRPLDYSSAYAQPSTDRQKHLQYLHSLLHVLLQRHPTLSAQKQREENAVRIGRILRVLWSSKEWREGDLWHEGLAWAGLERGDGQPSQQDEGDLTARRHHHHRRPDSDDEASAAYSTSASPATANQKRRRLDSVDAEADTSMRPGSPSLGQKDRSTTPNSDQASASEQKAQSTAGNAATADSNDPPSPARSRSRSSSSASSSSSSSSASSLLSSAESDIESAPFATPSAATSEQRLGFLRLVSSKRRALRPALLHARLLELLASVPASAAGTSTYDQSGELTAEEREAAQSQARRRQYYAALEELELTLQSPEYRESKELNYLAGMLRILCISAD